MPLKKEDLPSTLQRSPEKVQNTYVETLDSAEETYDSEERAHRAAWATRRSISAGVTSAWTRTRDSGSSVTVVVTALSVAIRGVLTIQRGSCAGSPPGT